MFLRRTGLLALVPSKLSFHVPKTAMNTVLGSKLSSEYSNKEEEFRSSEAGQRQAGRRRGHQKLLAHILIPALDHVESKVCFIRVKDFQYCCFGDIH